MDAHERRLPPWEVREKRRVAVFFGVAAFVAVLGGCLHGGVVYFLAALLFVALTFGAAAAARRAALEARPVISTDEAQPPL